MTENIQTPEVDKEKKYPKKLKFKSLDQDSIEKISLRLFKIKKDLDQIRNNISDENEKIINKVIKEISFIDKYILSETNVKFSDNEKEKSLRILEKFATKK